MNARKRMIIGFIISAVCLGLALWGVNWPLFFEQLISADVVLLVLAAVAFTLSIVARAAGWGQILAPRKGVKLADLFTYECIGYLANNILPVKMGEFVRMAVVAERQQLSQAEVLSTIVVERILDILLLFVLGIAVILFLYVPVEAANSIIIVGSVALLVFFTMWLIARNPCVLVVLWQKMSGRLKESFAKRVDHWLTDLLKGLAILNDSRHFVAALGGLALSWGLTALTTGLILEAMHLNVPWYAMFVQLVVVNLGAMIPASPGGIGVAHYLSMLVLSLWEIDKGVALSFAIIFHGVPYLLTLLLGMLSIFRVGWNQDWLSTLGKQRK